MNVKCTQYLHIHCNTIEKHFTKFKWIPLIAALLCTIVKFMQTKKRTKNAKITALSEGWLSGYDVGLWPTDFSLPVPIP